MSQPYLFFSQLVHLKKMGLNFSLTSSGINYNALSLLNKLSLESMDCPFVYLGYMTENDNQSQIQSYWSSTMFDFSFRKNIYGTSSLYAILNPRLIKSYITSQINRFKTQIVMLNSKEINRIIQFPDEILVETYFSMNEMISDGSYVINITISSGNRLNINIYSKQIY